jgi:hypothetical protein
MAKETQGVKGDAPEYVPVNRWKIIGAGVLMGFLFGSLMWLVTGAEGGWRIWAYLAITTAMLGAGVSAAFGASAVRKRGERVTPSFRRRR